MEIYKKQPIDVLVDLTKSLLPKIPIYREVMPEQPSQVPNSYILLRSQISDSISNYGDGQSLIRSADCDVILVTKGYGDSSTDLHNINKALIRGVLKDAGVNFQEFNLGYDNSIKSTQHNFSFEVKYFG